MKTQNEMILAALRKGREITPLDAISEWNCFRLGARIHNLRQQGYNIITDIVTSSTGKHYASYRMVK